MEMLPDRKMAPAQLGDVLVLGRGVSGQAVLDYLEPLVGTRVHTLTCAEGDAPGEGHFDLCIASPGISQFSDIYQTAARMSDELIGEVEFAWRESAADSLWIAITGTNGKTTTTALCAHVMEACGYEVRCVGNIGDAAITAVGHDTAGERGVAPCCAESPSSHEMASKHSGVRAARCVDAASQVRTVYVVECSSYQLASTVAFAPNVAVVLNITPDHLAWHRTHRNYAEAKWNIMRHLAASDGVAVLNATDDEVRARVRAVKDDPDRGFDYIPLGTAEGIAGDMRARCGARHAAFCDASGMLRVAFAGEDAALCAATDLQLEGSHNIENALAAAAAAVAAGADRAQVAQALTSFAPLPHRIEPVGTVAGVRFYNDSKATNTDATCKAICAFAPDKPIVLLGGRDKGTDLEPLVTTCRANARGVVLYGESLPRFAEAFAAVEDIRVQQAATLAEAFEVACAGAQPGDIVLLSPACASFDEFSCFEERGDRFKQLVADARARQGE
ncbi:UDP-N-acetylmuramoyl-L-alanine--D-glutamate ligase [Adlercreutzia murintestinalis]|uniref:UDP-N-acetylmuramoyl-L-alanine--D-glutamate ligase n=1 Tax=Adlercreutzia murintestinalis TaxID=2941325 RepID=UPI00204246CF|nr:UDP-N-acetylmuramoyl-L-alanine--D-glutamate ligase [Adlercreutzia murintestinalis]